MQELIVLMLVVWSLWRVLRRYAPQLMYRVQNALATLVKQIGWARLAAWLTPVVPVAAGCGSGCDGCASGAPSSCASPATPAVEHTQAAPVQWR